MTESPDDNEPEKPGRDVATADSDDYFTAYANSANFAHTFFDFQIHFAEIKVRNLQNIVVESFATIIMSPQHAKAFLEHLSQNVALYEARFGEIKIPDNVNESQNVDFDIKNPDLPK